MAIGDWNLLSQLPAWGIPFASEQQHQLKQYLELLYEANQRFNLTRVPPDQAVGRHLIDSLCMLKVFQPPVGAKLIDLGTGAGLPGIPLKIVCPHIELTLLDSHRKTVDFLHSVCEALALQATIVWARAEEYAHSADAREQFDWVVARAVAKMPVLAEIMLPFAKVSPESKVLALKSQHEQEEILGAEPAIRQLGGALTVETVQFETEQGPTVRLLACMRKVSPTPPAYPRRWNQILKQPLGAKP